jgi:anthranilate synthase/phosphoribosyltransferase
MNADKSRAALDELGVCFLFAPKYHTAGGGDINAVAAVATGADDVGKQVVRARERRGVFQQRGGVSSKSGSSDLLAAFGINLDMNADKSRAALDELGVPSPPVPTMSANR